MRMAVTKFPFCFFICICESTFSCLVKYIYMYSLSIPCCLSLRAGDPVHVYGVSYYAGNRSTRFKRVPINPIFQFPPNLRHFVWKWPFLSLQGRHQRSGGRFWFKTNQRGGQLFYFSLLANDVKMSQYKCRAKTCKFQMGKMIDRPSLNRTRGKE